MHSNITFFSDKIVQMIRSMVYLAMKVSCGRGATVQDISDVLQNSVPADRGVYQEGIIERVLADLRFDGKVARAGAHWYLVGEPA